MEPTVLAGDRILVNKAAYGLRVPLTNTYLLRFRSPKRGDVVVLESPENGKTLLKRVVAVPGDRVAVTHGRVQVDRVTDEEDDVRAPFDGPRYRLGLGGGGGPDLAPTIVPAGSYLVLGDNRGNSHDGRVFGFVNGGTIHGRALRIYLRSGALSWRPLDLPTR